MYPGGVLDLARLVEVIDKVVGLREHVAGIVAHGHGAPRRIAGRLHIALHASGIGREPGLKHHVLIVEVEVHGGIVDAGGLMDVDIQSVLGLHLQGCLYAGGREDSHGGVVPVHGIVETGADLRELALLRFLLLCVVVARQPPGGMVACHGKLGVLVLDDEVDQ